jgi:VanZ family protein
MIAGIRFRRTWLLLGWLLILAAWVGSLMPAHILHPVARIPDKVQHAAVYLSMTLWFAGLYPKRVLWRIALAFFLMGCAVEVAQGVFTSTRDMDWHDVIANSTGIVLAVTIASVGLAGWAAWLERALGASSAP